MSAAVETQSPVIELRHITKRFGGVVALDDVSLSVSRGETVGLLGDNGAGKSTLVRIISGAHAPTEGQLFIGGNEISHHSPARALHMGVETVYQSLFLVDHFSVAENFFLGRELVASGIVKRLGILRSKAMAEQARQGLASLNVTIPGFDSVPVGKMSGGQRQAIAIAKAAHWGKSALLMDEPTAALGVRESGEVLELIEEMSRQGFPMIIVSHNIQHVWRICTRFIVLRGGSVVADVAREDTSPEAIVRYITGADKIIPATAFVVGETAAT